MSPFLKRSLLIAATSSLVALAITSTRSSPQSDQPTFRLLDGVVGSGSVHIDNAGNILAQVRDRVEWLSVNNYRCPTPISEIFRIKDLNNRGTVVVCLNSGMHAHKRFVLVTACGKRKHLTQLPPHFVPNAINDRDQIVGFHADSSGRPRGFRWSKCEGIVELSDETGMDVNFAHGINNRGQIVGQAMKDRISSAFLWDPAAGFRLLHPPGAQSSCAYSINNRGDVVGTYTLGNIPRACMWRSDGQFLEIYAPADIGAELRVAADINDQRQVVGLAFFNGTFRFFALSL